MRKNIDLFGRKQRKKNKEKQTMLRVEELRKLMQDGEGNIDPETVLSMYIPQRKRKKVAAALLQIDRMQLIFMTLLFGIAVLFIMAFMQEKTGNFTINLNRLELYRRGISIADNGGFEKATSRLTANTVQDASNITITDLPKNLHELEGDNNGLNYMSYTYFIRNAGKETVNYLAQIQLEEASKGAQEAVRVEVWRNGERIVYAAPTKSGEPEPDCTNFLSDDLVCNYEVKDFYVGNVDKYTINIWMEGTDPECVDKIIGGSVRFDMHINALMDEDESLITWFVQDIKDFLTGNKPIDAAGTVAPDYMNDKDITYENRNNQ